MSDPETQTLSVVVVVAGVVNSSLRSRMNEILFPDPQTLTIRNSFMSLETFQTLLAKIRFALLHGLIASSRHKQTKRIADLALTAR